MEFGENFGISRETNIEKYEEKHPEKYEENERLLERTKEKLLDMGIFDKEFINGLSFVFVDSVKKEGEGKIKEYRLNSDGSNTPINGKNLDRTRDVVTASLDYSADIDALFDISNDRIKSSYLWLGNTDTGNLMSFDAVATHEIAHAKSYQVITKEKETFFDEEKFEESIAELVGGDEALSKEGTVDLSRFEYSAEKWSELYAMLYQREYLRRKDGDNHTIIKVWDSHIVEVANDLRVAMEKFNQEKGTNIDPDIVYRDGHAFSYLMARIFEEKYIDFEERIASLERYGKK